MKMDRLANALMAAGATAETVALALMMNAVESVRVVPGYNRMRALTRIAQFANMAAGEYRTETVLASADDSGYLPAHVLHAVLKYLTGQDAWRLLGDLRRNWSDLEPGTVAHNVLLMYAALEQEAVAANQTPPVIEGRRA